MRNRWLSTVLMLCCTAAFAQIGTPAPAAPSSAERRFPQPVSVGSLIGRDVLQPTEAQPILGHVKQVVRGKDGRLDMIITFGGVLGIGARPIAVPVDAMALLGEYVACVDLLPEQLQALQTNDGTTDQPLAANETIRVGIVRPFH